MNTHTHTHTNEADLDEIQDGVCVWLAVDSVLFASVFDLSLLTLTVHPLIVYDRQCLLNLRKGTEVLPIHGPNGTDFNYTPPAWLASSPVRLCQTSWDSCRTKRRRRRKALRNWSEYNVYEYRIMSRCVQPVMLLVQQDRSRPLFAFVGEE